jgi:hypothetical protein
MFSGIMPYFCKIKSVYHYKHQVHFTCPLSSSPPYLAFPPSNIIDKLPAMTMNGTKHAMTRLNFQPEMKATTKQPMAVTKEEIAKPTAGPVAFKQIEKNINSYYFHIFLHSNKLNNPTSLISGSKVF